MLNQRQDKILDLVIKNYVASAEPVGSRLLLGIGGIDCGEATIRNELRALEEAGYLTHPHTSSGRVPTAKGYNHYLQKTDWQKLKASKKDEDFLKSAVLPGCDKKQMTKNAAKALAELSGQAVIVAFNTRQVYYTGLYNIFSQPEFNDPSLISRVSLLFDQCEDCLEDFLVDLSDEPKCFVGSSQPFGKALSLVAGRAGNSAEAVILLGPRRMDYHRNYTLVKKSIELI